MAMSPIDDHDRAAFDLAIEIARRDPAQRLGLMPWMSPPMFADMSALSLPFGDPGAKRETAELALRMQRCGISRWHPSPAAVCEAAEAEQRGPR